MKTRFAVAVAVGLVGFHVSGAAGFQPSGTGPLTNYDRRVELLRQAPAAPVTAGPTQEQAEARLKSLIPDAKVTRDTILGTPSFITATRGFLTGPGGKDKALSETSLASVPTNDPHRLIKAFLNEHSALFGFDAGALANAKVERDYVTSYNGLHTTIWHQTLDDIPVFEGLLVGHVTRNDELVSVSSHFIANVEQAGDKGTPNRRTVTADPPVSVARAIQLAASNLGRAVETNSVTLTGAPEGAERHQTARAPGLFGNSSTRLVWLPLDQSSLRLCWQVVLCAQPPEHYLILVDAVTGEVLVRHSLTAHISPAAYRIYPSDSPSPLSPGLPTPSSFQPTNVNRIIITNSALDVEASPNGWINDGDDQTSGNNVTAFLDRDFNDVPDVPLPQGTGAGRVFDFPLDLNQEPLSYASASTVQLFYRGNWYHDRLYQLGFTEAAGNFQTDNFGRGGLGNDNVRALVQAGADVGFADNSAFSTPPDGENGYCFMFVFTGPNPDRDGSLDQEVVCHEFTHGLSNRLLGGGVGIYQLQTEGMGEGWSDFYSLCLLSEATDNVNSNYAEGGYVTYLLTGTGMTENYYYGIRRYPYTTDMNKNPLTFKDIDPTRASLHFGVPISPIFGASDPSEVHNQGEVWCVTLREVWANIVTKSGWAIGNELVLQLVTDGLKLAPANATFLEARDAIIQADLIDTGGDNFSEIWFAFAKRGMGYSAQCPTSDTTTGVFESFDLPPEIGTPDGILEVKVTPPSLEAMFAGETNIILVRVSDALPVINATINATISGGTNLVFRNDGVAPDQLASNAVYSALLKVPTNQSSITINMIVSAPGKETNLTSVTYFIVPVPPNDNFTNAIKVPVAGTNYFTSNRRATIEPFEPVHAGITTVAASLWWNYTPTVNTNVLVDTGSSSFRSVVAVYTNQTLATLVPIASAVGSVSRPGALVKFNALAGRTYHIAVAGYDSKSTGSLSLNIAPGGQADTNPPTVTITSPLNGQVLSTNRVVLTGSAVDPSPNPSGIKDITIRVVPVAGAEYTTVVSPSLNGPISTNWSSIVGLLPGLSSIQVTVSDFAGNVSSPASIQLTYRALNPINDFFVNAIALTGTSGTNGVNTSNATKEAGEPNHAGVLGGKSAWWTYTPATDGVLTLSTSNSTFDTVLAMYTGTNVSQLTPVAANDDAYPGAPGGFSRIDQAVRAGTTYRIAVDGFDGQSGVVFLTYSFVPATVYHVSVSATAGGSVSPTAADVQNNGTIVVTASPDPAYRFDIWDGSVVSLNNPLTLVVNGNMSLTAHFLGADFTDGFESGNLQHIGWTTSGPAIGDKPWFVQTNVVAVGRYAARSGGIGNSQSSSLVLTANFRAGDGSFDYRVSSEPSFDLLQFFVDGVLQQQWSGEAGWANFAFPLTAGTHTLKWSYSKDVNGSSGLDAAFIDDVNLPLVVGTDSSSAATLQLQRDLDGSFFVSFFGQTNQQYVLQTSTNLFNWQNLATNVAASGFLRFSDPTSSTNRIQFYRAVAVPQ